MNSNAAHWNEPLQQAGAKAGRITVCFPLAGDAMGGSHVSLLGLLHGLNSESVRIIVVPETPDGRLARHYAGFEQIADPAPPRHPFEAGRRFGLLNVVRTFSSLMPRARFLREQGVSIVHTNDGRTHASWALAAKLAGVRLVWHHRGDPTARGLRYVAPLVADRIVTVSQFALPRMRLGAARHARVIHSPFDVSVNVDRALARERLIAELNLDPATLICGYFGTFIERKRPLDFVKAVERLADQIDRPVVGLMFGEPEETQIFATLSTAVAASRGRVRLMGYRTPGSAWLAACDILLVPAIGEPLGRTLVEAMLVGTPVVATDSGGNPEALAGGFGVLVRGNDPSEMARAAHALMNDPVTRSEMVARARASARLRFSQEQHVESVTELYADMMR